MSRISPLRYPGGKGKLYKTVKDFINENNFTDHEYIEPYAGGAGLALSLLLNGNVTSIHINDMDRSIFSFWHSILYRTNEFVELIKTTPITVSIREEMKLIQNNKEHADLLELGFSTFYLNRTNRSGILKGGVIGGKGQDGDYLIDCRFNKLDLIKRILRISEYRNQITITNYSAEEFIYNHLSKFSEIDKVFVNFDPPYYKKGEDLYTNFYKHDDHVQLEKLITKYVKVPWIMTYDNCSEICSIYNGYRIKEFTLTHSAGQSKIGKEVAIFCGRISLLPTF